MRKKTLFLIISILALTMLATGCTGGGSGGSSVSDEALIKETLELFATGYRQNNVDKIVLSLSDPCVIDGYSWTRQEIRVIMLSEFEEYQMLDFQFSQIDITRSGNSATVTANYYLRDRDKDSGEIYTENGKYYLELRKSGSTWLISKLNVLEEDEIESFITEFSSYYRQMNSTALSNLYAPNVRLNTPSASGYLSRQQLRTQFQLVFDYVDEVISFQMTPSSVNVVGNYATWKGTQRVTLKSSGEIGKSAPINIEWTLEKQDGIWRITEETWSYL